MVFVRHFQINSFVGFMQNFQKDKIIIFGLFIKLYPKVRKSICIPKYQLGHMQLLSTFGVDEK